MNVTESILNNPNTTDDSLATILKVAMQNNKGSIIKKVIVHPRIGSRTIKMFFELLPIVPN